MRNIVILVLFALVGCKKETPSVTPPVDCSNVSDFVIGVENDCVSITTFDTPITIVSSQSIGPWPGVDSSFDINNDGQNDFSFTSTHAISLGGVRLLMSSIIILNGGIHISVIDLTDTVHECIYPPNPSFEYVVDYNNNSTYECVSGLKNELIGIFTNTHPKVYNMNDTINHSETWSDYYSQELNLSYFDNFYSHFMYYQRDNYILRGNWNNTNKQYIVFQRNDGVRDYYGWLKLDVTNNKEIHFYGYAYQKGFF